MRFLVFISFWLYGRDFWAEQRFECSIPTLFLLWISKSIKRGSLTFNQAVCCAFLLFSFTFQYLIRSLAG